MAYTIGQVVFAVLNKKSQVYPMRVIEVITKKTLSGEDVKYLLQAGADKSSTIMLDQVEGEIFDFAERARTELIKRATAQINRLVDNANVKAREWYGAPNQAVRQEPQRTDDLPDMSSSAIPDTGESLEIMMPDGSMAVAKVKLPDM